MSDRCMKSCHLCQTSSAVLRRCTGCYAVYYCSKDCQGLDWASHKPACRKPTSPSSGEHGTCTLEDESHTNSSSEKSDAARSGGVEVNEESKITDTAGAAAGENAVTEAAKGTNPAKTTKRKGTCMACRQIWRTRMCGKCNVVFYCSETCQKKDWPTHKQYCKKVSEGGMPKKNSALTDNEILIIENMKKRQQKDEENDSRKSALPTGKVYVCNYSGPRERIDAAIPPYMLRIHERPTDSLARALRYTRANFPGWNVIDVFDDIPAEVPQMPMFQMFQKQFMRNILVAFMFMYHDHVMRHGVFLKDSSDNITHVEFYFDHLADNPWPFFTYAEVSPGNYILIKNPVVHHFKDGQVGLRIDDPSEVKIYKIDTFNWPRD